MKHIGSYNGTIKIVPANSRTISWKVLDQVKPYQTEYPSKSQIYSIRSSLCPSYSDNYPHLLFVRGWNTRYDTEVVSLRLKNKESRLKRLAEIIEAFTTAGFTVEL